MSYTIKDLEMIQDFIVRNEKDLKIAGKFETLDKLQKEMERDILYQRYIDTGLPRVFVANDEMENNFKEDGMTSGMIAMLVDRDETVEFEGVKSKKNQITALVINGRDKENDKLAQPQAEFLGECIIYSTLIKLHSSKDLVELALKYRNKKTDYNPTEVVSTRPAPKPTVDKEVISGSEIEKAKTEEATHIDNAFDDKEVKDAQNLLGTPTAEDIVEKQVEDEKHMSSFGGKKFVFGEENNVSEPKAIKKAGSKGVKPKFAGFTDTQYTAEDGLVNEDGIPLKFALNDVAKKDLGKEKGSTNLAELVSPETFKTFTQGTHDTTEEEMKAMNAKADAQVTVFGKPRVDGEYTPEEVRIPNLENIYFVDEEDMLSGVARDNETREYIKAHFDELKREGNYIVIENGSMRKLDGSADFTLDEREYLVEQFRNIITDPNVDNLGIPKDVIEVMEMEVEDWDNNQEIDNID